MSRWIGVAVACLSGVPVALAQGSGTVSEKDFLADMPVVLSVSRLPQRLDETPGAVTVLDRDMIRLSGARDVADLMLLVPGFQSSTSFEADAPQASYHGGFGAYAGRIQVLIDGRSAYSPFLLGSVAPGLLSVPIADIERIEVLRGSNSAAYGARAFLGVINSVTRDPVDTLGLRANAAVGENGIRDVQASVGWSLENASFRLGADQRADEGLEGANGRNRVNRVNFRADLRPTLKDELQLRLGGLGVDSGAGYTFDPGRAQRPRQISNSYLQLDWRRNLGPDSDLALSYSHSDESYKDNFSYPLPAPLNEVTIDFGGRASSDTLSVQHSYRSNADLRLVWGGEFRQEQVVSRPLYDTLAPQETRFTRVFGNAEWRAGRDVVVNAGGLLETNSRSADLFSPRLMVNWHFAPGQTLRAGVSKAFRPPSTYETSSNTRYIANGVLISVASLSRGGVLPESVVAREIGYLGEFPRLGASLDVRAFHEQVGGFVRLAKYLLPAGTQLIEILSGYAPTFDYVNAEDFAIKGLEYQLKWRPWAGSQFTLNQAWTSIGSMDQGDAASAPNLASTLMWMQKLPGGADLSLIHHERGRMKLQGTDQQFSMSRTDLRLGMPLQVGRHRGDLALVVQNLGAPYQDYDQTFLFKRRAYVSLRLDH